MDAHSFLELQRERQLVAATLRALEHGRRKLVEEGWTQGALARDSQGNEISPVRR